MENTIYEPIICTFIIFYLVRITKLIQKTINIRKEKSINIGPQHIQITIIESILFISSTIISFVSGKCILWLILSLVLVGVVIFKFSLSEEILKRIESKK